MLTIETDRGTFIVTLTGRDMLDHVHHDKPVGATLLRYGRVRDGGLLELAFGSIGLTFNYHTQA